MDCFYAAIEIRERPELVDKPVAVGGQSRRGVLTTCNYVAREFGVRSAMPVFKAIQLCPRLICLPVRFELYRSESARIREVFFRYTDLVEPLSLDEAYLDLSERPEPATELAKRIRADIFRETGLTASAGISSNKLVAKIASDWNKPNGQKVVRPERIEAFMRDLPVRRLWGVGPKSSARFASIGIQTCGDLQKLPTDELRRYFGNFGLELYQLCRGVDDRPVSPHRARKSMSNEHTFSENLTSPAACEWPLKRQVEELLEDLAAQQSNRVIHKAFIKLKFDDFSKTTMEILCERPTYDIYRGLLESAWKRGTGRVRLIGAGVRFRDEVAWEQMELVFRQGTVNGK